MTKEEKKNYIRTEILKAAKQYRDNLVGKYFLYVFDERYIEVLFQKDNFKHLTGVDSRLSGKDFYAKAKQKQLTSSQFFFSATHSYSATKKKIDYLHRLPELTYKKVFILEEMETQTVTYKFGFTNLDFSLGVVQNKDNITNEKINDFYLPQTFRVKDNSFERSKNVYLVDYIFMKVDAQSKYNVLMFGDLIKVKELSDEIKEKILL